MNEEEKEELQIFVPMKPRIDTALEFTFLSPFSQKLKSSQVEAKAILLPTPITTQSSLDEMELEEYEFDIMWDESKQLWVATLVDGTYLINVKAAGFCEINESVEIRKGGQKDYQYIMKKSESRPVKVQAVNVENGVPL